MVWTIFTGVGKLDQLRRRRKLPGADDLMAEDPRDPVLYLRSFDQDSPNHENARFLGLIAIGPVVAVSRPGQRLKPFGAARLDLGDDWKERVTELMTSASGVIFDCAHSGDPGSGFMWEIEEMVRDVDPTKAIGLVRRPKLYAEWSRALPESMRTSVPPVEGIRSDVEGWLVFTEDRRPCIVPAERNVLGVFPSGAVLLDPDARQPIRDLAEAQSEVLQRRSVTHEASGREQVSGRAGRAARRELERELDECYAQVKPAILEVQFNVGTRLIELGVLADAYNVCKATRNEAERIHGRKHELTKAAQANLDLANRLPKAKIRTWS